MTKPTELLSAILETVAALVVVLDSEGRIVFFNRACERATGYRASEMEGSFIWDRLLVPEEAGWVRQVFEKLRAGQFPSRHTNHWVGRNGEERLIAWTNTALVGTDGSVQNVIGTGIDVTEEKRLAEKARRAEHLASLATISAGVAHEIKNPLNTAHLQLILASRQLTRKPAPDIAATLQAVDAVKTELKRMQGLLEEFLKFAQPRPLRLSTIELNRLTSEVVEFCRAEGDEAGVQLRLEPGEEIAVRADGERLRQVLLNLVRNAMQAAGKGGLVRLALARRNGLVVVDVEDDGPGPLDPTARLFEPFFTTKKEGAGLGLTVSHRIVSDHGGEISVRRQSGRTIFSVRLPLKAKPPR